MSRRIHQKSRRGCVACKQRHLKCDETRPGCTNCTTVKRRCPYLDQLGVIGALSSTLSPSSDVPLSLVGSASLQGSGSTDSYGLHLPPLTPDVYPEPLVNVEALSYWLSHTQSVLFPTEGQAQVYGPIILNYALAFPFLMKGILALATLHMSTKNLERQIFYRGHSKRLHDEGLTGFNSVVTCLNSENANPAFVFAVVAGICQFGHLFQMPNYDSDAFLDQLIKCMQMFRGVSIIIAGRWNDIKSSELKVIIDNATETQPVLDEQTRSTELDGLRLFLQSADLEHPIMAIYETAIEQLQSAFDKQGVGYVNNDARLCGNGGTAFVWLMTLSTDFHQLLEERKPEALIIVAHMAPLLYSRKDCWMVGNAGHFLMDSIGNYVGPEWAAWLACPRSTIGL